MSTFLSWFVQGQGEYPHLSALLLCLIKSSLIVGLSAGAVILGGGSALSKKWIWRCSLLGLLALAFWEFGPESLTKFHPVWQVETVPTQLSFPVQDGRHEFSAENKNAGSPAAEPSPTLSAAPNLPAEKHDLRGLEHVLPLLWFLGTAGFILGQAAKIWAGHFWLRKSSSAAPTALRKECGNLLASPDGASGIFICRGLRTPLLTGWIKPVVFLPEDCSQWDAKKLEAVMLHEWAHWQQRDGWWQAGGALIAGLWWWNPLVWWALRRMKAEAEQVADDAVILKQQDAPTYAQTLLDIASAPQRDLRDLGIGVAMIGKFPLETRLRAILRDDPKRGKLGTPGKLVLVSLTVVLLALGALYFGADQSQAMGMGSAGKWDITGVVVDEKGQPVQGAEVRIRSVDGINVPRTKSPGEEFPEPDFKSKGISDAKGRFILKNKAPYYIFNLAAMGPGYGPGYVENVVPEKGPVQIKTYKLDVPQTEAKILGRVVDSQGRAIEGAQVRVNAYYWWSTASNYAGRFENPTQTDKQGNFSLGGMPKHEGEYIQGTGLLITAPGFAPKYFSPVPYNNHREDMLMEKGATVTGRLVKDGKPLPNIKVGIESPDDSYDRTLGEVTAITDQEGRFNLENVAGHTEYLIYAKRDSLGLIGVPIQQKVKVEEPAGVISIGDLQVKSGTILKGRIIFSGQEKPVLHQQVQLHVFRRSSPDYQYQDLKPDLQFELMVREGENLELSAYIPGYQLSAKDGLMKIRATPELKAVEMLYVPEAARAGGEKVSENNTFIVTPVAPAGVKLEQTVLQTPLTAKKPLDWKPLPDGTLQVELASEDYLIRVLGRDPAGQIYFSQPLLLTRGSRPPAIRVELVSGRNVKGKLDSSVPRPVRDGLIMARVTGESPDSEKEPNSLYWDTSAEVDAEGNFELKNLPPAGAKAPAGTNGLELIATCRGYASKDIRTVNAEYAIGAQTCGDSLDHPLTVSMEPLGQARILVLSPEGKPLPETKVEFSPQQRFRNMWTNLGQRMETSQGLFPGGNSRQRDFIYQAVTDKNGVALVEGLPAGVEPFVVEQADYEMPIRLRTQGSPTKYSRDAIALIKPGERAEVEIRLQPKTGIFSLKNATSPDGRLFVQIEPNRSGVGMNPQSVTVWEAGTKRLIATFDLPSNSSDQIDPVTAAGQVKVEWNPASAFFVLSVQGKEGLVGIIVQVNAAKMSCSISKLSLNYVPPARTLSYEFIKDRTLKIETQLSTGKIVYNQMSVFPDGSVGTH